MIPSVAIVGRAWRTPLGHGIDEVMARLHAGERAARVSPRAEGFACTLEAAVQGEPGRSRNGRYLRRLGLFGLDVAREALAASGIAPGPRVGLFSGVGGLRAHWDDMLAALDGQRDDGERAWERGLRDVHPYWMLRHLSNSVHALSSAELALRGEGATFGGGNGGAQALAAATRALAAGAVDAALVVAHDSLLEPETRVELGARRAATHAGLDGLVAPYAADAAGSVPGEAAAAVVLVRPGDAAPDAARVAALAIADGAAAEPTAATLQRLVARLAGDARTGGGAAPRFVVDGAARAWPELDAGERAGIAAVLPVDTPLTAMVAATGHLGAATAVVQTIVLAEALRRGTLPPVAGLRRAAGGPCRPLTEVGALDGHRALGLSTGAPGLAAAVRVEVSP